MLCGTDTDLIIAQILFFLSRMMFISGKHYPSAFFNTPAL